MDTFSDEENARASLQRVASTLLQHDDDGAPYFDADEWQPEATMDAVLQMSTVDACRVFFERMRSPLAVNCMTRHILHTCEQAHARTDAKALRDIVARTFETLTLQPLALCVVFRRDTEAVDADTAEGFADEWMVYPFGVHSLAFPFSVMRGYRDIAMLTALLRMVALPVTGRRSHGDAAFLNMAPSSSGDTIVYSNFAYDATFDDYVPRASMLCTYMFMSLAHCIRVDEQLVRMWFVPGNDGDGDGPTSEVEELRSLYTSVLNELVATMDKPPHNANARVQRDLLPHVLALRERCTDATRFAATNFVQRGFAAMMHNAPALKSAAAAGAGEK